MTENELKQRVLLLRAKRDQAKRAWKAEIAKGGKRSTYETDETRKCYIEKMLAQARLSECHTIYSLMFGKHVPLEIKQEE